MPRSWPPGSSLSTSPGRDQRLARLSTTSRRPVRCRFRTQGTVSRVPAADLVSNLVGDIVGWDHIFGVALIQRGLLVAAVGMLIWALQWWSVPLAVVATSSSFVVHADLVLPEGTLVPACLLLGGLLAVSETANIVARLANST